MDFFRTVLTTVFDLSPSGPAQKPVRPLAGGGRSGVPPPSTDCPQAVGAQAIGSGLKERRAGARPPAPGRAPAGGPTGSQRLEGRRFNPPAELLGTHTHRLRPWICVSPRPPLATRWGTPTRASRAATIFNRSGAEQEQEQEPCSNRVRSKCPGALVPREPSRQLQDLERQLQDEPRQKSHCFCL